MMHNAFGSAALISFNAAIPSLLGIVISSVTRSGFNSLYLESASTPSAASPHTSKPPFARRPLISPDFHSVGSAGRRMIFGQTQHNVTSRFIREIGKEHYIKQDNYTKNKDMHDNSVTEVQSLSLQQQIAMAKRQTAVKATNTAYEAGERVSHMIFGEGTIISATPASNDYMLEIAFDKVGTKRIMSNFAKLEII